MTRTILRGLITAVVCAGVLAGAVYRLSVLHKAAYEPRKAASEAAEDRELFRALLKAGLLTPRADGGLDQAPADYLLVKRVEGRDAASGPELEVEKGLIRGLYATAVGAIVRQQVRLWNDTRHLAAVRDKRSPGGAAGEADWRAFGGTGHPLRAGDLVPATFGFVHGGRLEAGYGEWLSVSGDRGEVTFRTTVAARESGTLSLQVIGRPVKLPPGAKVSRRTGDFPWPCAAKPEAALVRVPLRPGQGPRTLELRVVPSAHCAPRVHGLAIWLDKNAEGKYRRYDWRPVRRSRPSGRFAISTADGVRLTDPERPGQPTEDAYRLGLVPIVGFGPADSFSLSGMLAQRRLAGRRLDVALTIDSAIQLAAHEALSWGLSRFSQRGALATQRKGALVVLDADTGAILAAASQPTVPRGARPWDLSSFATAYPLRDPTSVLAWEVIDRHNTPGSTFKPLVAVALMRAPKERREKLAHILRGLDEIDLWVETGLLPEDGRYAPTAIAKRAIDNFGRANIGRYFGRAQRDGGGCRVKAPVENTFGLVQAVQFSVNVWFARMAVMLDKPTIDLFAYGLRDARERKKGVRPPETRLMATARWLGLEDRRRTDLGSNLPRTAKLRRYDTEEGADILYAQRSKFALSDLRMPRASRQSIRDLLLWIVALNGIGQSVSVSPLQMARAVSAIASGKRAHPYLLSAWDGRQLAPPPVKPLGVDRKLLALLHRGMKAVPEVGTARGAFARSRAFRCRLHGKTGTAEIDRRKSFNSAWFIGWLEPATPRATASAPASATPPGTPPGTPEERRLAFACMITHAQGGLRTGGAACAPVVNKMFQALNPPR